LIIDLLVTFVVNDSVVLC